MDRPSDATIASQAGGACFISYATADRKQATQVCDSLERRGTPCWIAHRDVAPGENYQEAIVGALRQARAMVLLFSRSANHSDEIKKELSLASRLRVPVIALRLEDVEPSDAFAYELSTRQWIDAFAGREAAIDQLAARIAQLEGGQAGASAGASRVERPASRNGQRRTALIAAAVCAALLAIAAAWWLKRPSPAGAHSLSVRLAGFQNLSADVPAGTPAAVDAEIAAAFDADGVVGVSTAPAPPPGKSPAYALGGTIQLNGDSVRVITRLTSERSGATLWSQTFNYDSHELAEVPRHVAVDAGNVVRCGLFGASTYRKPLPDPVLRDYLQFCEGHWAPDLSEGRKALIPAQRVVAAAPDFSWGWAGVASAYWKVAMGADDPRTIEEARKNGREAADRAVAIDPKNSEALWVKSLLIDQRDWLGREALLKHAVAARRLDCGCEHHQYGGLLLDVGRVGEAVEQLHQANDMLALYVYTPLSLAHALVAAGKPDEANSYFDAAIDLAPDSAFASRISLARGPEGDPGDVIGPSAGSMPDEFAAAVVKGYRAAASPDTSGRAAAVRAEAVRALLALPAERQNSIVARLLARLGAEHEAFAVARRSTLVARAGPAVFWYPGMRGVLDDPGFPEVAAKLGLIAYWKAAKVKPDVCRSNDPPPFCRLI